MILDVQHAFITGRGSGIGFGAASALLADGATVTTSQKLGLETQM